MEEDKNKKLPAGAVWRIMKEYRTPKEKGIGKDVHLLVARYLEKQIEEITNAACDECESDGRKIITTEHLKRAGEKMGVGFE